MYRNTSAAWLQRILLSMELVFGYQFANFAYPGVPNEDLFIRVVELAQKVEAEGFDLLTVMDHLYQVGGVGPEDDPLLESYSILSALAARTSRIRLGTLVTAVTFRNPALLAKTVTTLDIISGGRAVLGIGAASIESEHLGYGIDFPLVGERIDRLDEALTICKLMFTEQRPSFQGKHYRIDRVLNQPRPIQPLGPKILVGGRGETRTIRLAARHADWTHWFGTFDELKHKDEVLRRHCDAEGRDPSTIVRMIGAPVTLVENARDAKATLQRITPLQQAIAAPATPEQAAEILGRYVDAGFTGFIFNNPFQTIRSLESLALAGQLIRLLR